MRIMSAISRTVLMAAVVATVPAASALAGAMPPEYADSVPARVSQPVQPAPTPTPAVSRPVGNPEIITPAPAMPEVAAPAGAPPLPASALTVTYAENVGLVGRYGYEDTKEDASLYCAQYGRVAVLDSRFEISDTWYVRFNCAMP